ncbi:MAG: SCO family protein [Deltaproteobacteria bacterium]|nr:SCO family protein [Deltaproteobacteria bacterium]NCP02919.1 SCO family protein [Deltaproteobacteria bacterium]
MAQRTLTLGALCLGGLLLWLLLKPAATGYERTRVDYPIPAVELRNQHDQPVALIPYLLGAQPVMLEFSYTSCTTLCTDMAVKFSNLQRRAGAEKGVKLVSISIDPQVDTPAVLAAYLKRYQAGSGWDYLTGSLTDTQKLMQVFGVSPTDMLTNKATLFLHQPGDSAWTRLDGRLDPQDLLREYQQLNH